MSEIHAKAPPNAMSEETEHRLSLRQADAARADLYAIHDELDFTGPLEAVEDAGWQHYHWPAALDNHGKPAGSRAVSLTSAGQRRYEAFSE